MIYLDKDWKREIARDSLALGSILFYFIVIIRAIIGEHALFIAQTVIAIIVLFLLSRVIKGNQYLARVFVLFVFTSLFYNDKLFTIFAFVLLVILLVSLNYLRVKRNVILNGLLLGIVSTVISYYLSPLLV